MGITFSDKQISEDRIDCDGSLRVTLSLTGAPDITENPADIVLALDRSGSMTGTPLADMKIGAKTFIDIIDEATDGSQDGNIGSGSRIGIVSFAGTATIDEQLITSVADLKTAVDAIRAGGSTNHADAFIKAGELLESSSGSQKIIVMFTDGKTTAGAPPTPIAEELKSKGIIIYCIGLIGEDGISIDDLNAWATPPSSAHVAVTPDSADLEQLFEDLAENISKPGATNIVIDEAISADFEITELFDPTLGQATQLDVNTIKWTIPALGVNGSESAVMQFDIRHTAETGGVKEVNDYINYTDDENNVVNFPSPEVEVECGDAVTEPCPVPVDMTVGSCKDSVVFDLGDVYLQSLGRIIQMNVNIKNVCPGKRVALAVILTETDQYGNEHQRGMKTFTIPAHNHPTCRDVLVKCIKFVLPEDLNVSGGSTNSLCSERNLKARLIAQNIDTDFVCCEDSTL